MQKSFPELRNDFNQNGFEFLMTDLDTAFSFTQRASQSNTAPEVKQRNVANARKGYDTVVQLRRKLELDSEQQGAFEEKRRNLMRALKQLGEQF